MSENSKELEFLLKIVNYMLKFYDSTIAVAVFLLLTLDSIMINRTPQGFLTLYILLAFIVLVDVIIFNLELISKILRLNSIIQKESKKILEKFLKSIFYLLILAQIIISPPEVPIKFILNNFASIDFYFLLTILLITGLYFSLLAVLKSIFINMFKSTSLEN